MPGEQVYRVVKSSQGPDTLLVQSGEGEVPLHSRIDPIREGRLYEERFDPSRFDLLIVLGTGLGYHLAGLEKRIGEYMRVICVDVLGGIETHIARNPVTSFLVKSPGIEVITGKDPLEVAKRLAELIDLDQARGVSVIEHPASLRAFGEYYGSIRGAIKRIIDRKAGNRATRKAFGSLYLRNALRNFWLLDGIAPVRRLFGAFTGLPAIIAASGPSLDGDADIIRRNQERFFIVAVDSALPALAGRGIIPDIVISIDPQPFVQEHFLGCDTGRAVIVCSLTSPPAVVRGEGRFLSLNSHPLSQLAREVYGDGVGSVDSRTGTVAGDAVELCVRCGFHGIGITGLDFSFFDYGIYARGTAYQRRYALHFQDRFVTVEGRNCLYILRSSGGLKRDGRFTRRSFLQYRHALEDYLGERRVGDVVFLNDRGITPGGTGSMGLDDFMARYPMKDIDKKEFLARVWADTAMLSAEPGLAALREASRSDLFRDLVDASIGTECGDDEASKYLLLAESSGKRQRRA
ncbi:MAG: DUF115 domain-containing protein [Spirochaetes bacterium]|nr:DUF115 domain-containing protein [Spirochaetota bacterium]